MNNDRPPRRPGKTWAYGYAITPPVGMERLQILERLMGEEQSNARLKSRMWEGRFVTEEQVTHILVLSDTPDQDLVANRRLAVELERMEAGFAVTTPMQVKEEE
jgi:hypothetical protein